MSDPQRVGPFRIVGRLGVGGMGWVYLGRSQSGRRVAVKVIRPELADDPSFRERFAREIDALRAVSGAFTAAVVEADPYGDPPWLATVHVAGPSLAAAVQEHGPFPEDQVRWLGAGLVEALRAIHAAGVVHRDLKPENVLLDEDGPRVIDFGISKVSGRTGLTQPGAILGTPSYMSPEQVMGRHVGPESDVFSLGGVLVYAATGHAPFTAKGDGLKEIFDQVRHGEPMLEGIPSNLRDLLARCLAKSPDQRPDVETLLDEIVTTTWDTGPETWPQEVAHSVQVYADEAESSRESIPPARSYLLLHVEALLGAGLTDRMVVEAVSRGRG